MCEEDERTAVETSLRDTVYSAFHVLALRVGEFHGEMIMSSQWSDPAHQQSHPVRTLLLSSFRKRGRSCCCHASTECNTRLTADRPSRRSRSRPLRTRDGDAMHGRNFYLPSTVFMMFSFFPLLLIFRICA